MRMVTLVVVAMALAVSGCTTTQVNPLSHELDYNFTPAPSPKNAVDKSIAVVPFEDGRMFGGANKTKSTSLMLNLVPLVWYTTGEVSHPEVVYNTTDLEFASTVKASGSMEEALPQILADHLGRARLFSKATFVTSEEVDGYDYVLRGRLVNSTVKAERYSYLLGPAAIAPYLLGAPMAKYSASLTVEWQLYNASGKPIGAGKAMLKDPIEQYVALYYGMWADNKTMPIGLYVEAIKTVNQQIINDVIEAVKAE